MSKKKSHQQYVEEIKAINPNIDVIEHYIDSKTSILHKCKKDNYEWMARPNNVLHGKGCPMCAGNIQKTHDQYINDVENINPNIIVVGRYINSHTSILHKCKIDGTEWNASPSHILTGRGCPTCGIKSSAIIRSMSQEEYKEVVNFYHNDIKVVGNYINTHTKILHQCKLCNHQWYIAPHNIKKNKGCPICGDGINYPNKFIYSLLNQLHIDFIPEYSKDWSNSKRYDIYIPSIDCIIENHGRQHYEECEYFQHELKNEQKNDEYKKQIAIENGITHYITIDCRKSELEWIKTSIISSTLPSLLAFSEEDINWNKCNQFATSSLVKSAAEYWNSGQNLKLIASTLNLHIGTIRNYLKQANKNGWCTYTPKEGHRRAGLLRSGYANHNARSVFCIEQKRIFKCIEDAVKATGALSSKISDCCRKVRNTAGGYHWCYVDDYVKSNGAIIDGAITLGLMTCEEAELTAENDTE